MKALLIRHDKIIDELGNIIEITLWQLPRRSKDKPHGYKYSLVYIADGQRIVGYDNAEGKGDHKHIKGLSSRYAFTSLKKLARDFYEDIEKIKKGVL
jgi:hypothetical protein